MSGAHSNERVNTGVRGGRAVWGGKNGRAVGRTVQAKVDILVGPFTHGADVEIHGLSSKRLQDFSS